MSSESGNSENRNITPETAPDDLLGVLDNVGIHLEELNALDRDFLAAIVENDGEASTRHFRENGLERQQVHYRYDKLGEELELVDVERVGLDEHDGRKENVATLTDRGQRLVSAGLLDAFGEPNLNLQALNRRLDRQRREIDELRDTVETLEDYISTVDNDAQQRRVDIVDRVIDVEHELEIVRTEIGTAEEPE